MGSIRSLTVNDISSLLNLLLELNSSLRENQEIVQDQVIENMKAMEVLEDTYENYVYVENENVVAFLSLLFYRSVYHKRGTVQINELIVKEGYRNRERITRIWDEKRIREGDG